jgi:hypothetical protein
MDSAILPANILALFEAQHLHPIAFDFKDLIPTPVGPEVATPQSDGYRPPGI